MAQDVTVDISDQAIISALNTPGGGVFKWRDEVARETVAMAVGLSPVNDPLNARHRAGWTGEFKASWGFDRVGSNGDRVRAVIYNAADHAVFVEEGRRRTFGAEVFSWTQHTPPGSTSAHLEGTSRRDGRHILARSVTSVVGRSVNGGFSVL